VKVVEVPAPRLRGAGLLGDGAGGDPPGPAAVRPVATPPLEGDRFRRATRECLLAVAAVKAAVAQAGLPEAALAGSRTGILYVTATGYAAANRAFLDDETSATLHFPYTSPSAVPGEVTIELGIRGPYVNLMGGGTTALHALWCAAGWLADGVADRVLLLAVESGQEIRDLVARARRLYDGPWVEGAACLVLEPGPGPALRWAAAGPAAGPARDRVEAVLDAVLDGARPAAVASRAGGGALGRAERAALAARRLAAVARPPGEALACGPLAAAARERAGARECLVTAAWRGDYGAVLWPSERG
jgi:hypothetical protein